MTRTYLVVFEKGKEAWGAFAPDIPGTGGMGDTLEQARTSLAEGIGYQLEYAIEKDIPFPDATTTIVDFSEFDPTPSESHYEIEWLTVTLPERTTHSDDLARQAA